MSGYSHLHRRGAAYWFRRRVPTDLLKVLGRTEWKESLGTKDLEEAKRRCRERAVATDREITAARTRAAAVVSPPLTQQEARTIAERQLAEWLNHEEASRMERGRPNYESQSWMLSQFAETYREDLATGAWQTESEATEEALSAAGRFYPADHPSFRLLAFEMLKVRVRLAEGVAKRQAGEIVEPPAVPELAPPAPAAVTVGHLIDAYRVERVKLYGDEATDRKYAHVFRALEEGLGRDRPIRSVTRADCRSLRDLMASMPKYMGRRYPGLTIELASAAAKRDGAPLIGDRTVWSYLTNLSAVFNWAVEEEWLERNPAKGVAERGTAQIKRRGFKPGELEVLFRSLEGLREEDPWRFWMPAMALYSGARAGELAQLLVGDIKRIEGRYCFDLSEFDGQGVRVAGKRLKTEASERIVPVHPALIRAGFLRFVKSRGQPADRLFPELREGPNGGYSHDLSRWFGRHLDRIGLGDPTLTFHGFRHGFRDAGARARIPDATIDVLGGWRTPGVGAGYGNRRALVELLFGELKKVEYGEFRLPKVPRLP